MNELNITIPESSRQLQQPQQKYSLEIDCRENRIARWYKENCDDDRIIVKQLKVNDFIFFKNDVPFVCIERKRLDDFASSIRDGRYKTQKFDMINFASEWSEVPRLVYLVEEFSIKSSPEMDQRIGKTNITKETIMSAITKIMFRDGFQVIFTRDVEDTIRWLNKIWENLCKGEFEGHTSLENSNQYFDSLSRKMSQRTTSQMKNIERNHTNHTNHTDDTNPAKNWWMFALTIVNGVSVAKAHQIIKRYPSVRHLLEAYDKCENCNAKSRLLGNIRVNTRRIGDVVSTKVYEHITGDICIGTNPKKTKSPKKTKPSKKTKNTQTPKRQIDLDVCLIDSDSEGW